MSFESDGYLPRRLLRDFWRLNVHVVAVGRLRLSRSRSGRSGIPSFRCRRSSLLCRSVSGHEHGLVSWRAVEGTSVTYERGLGFGGGSSTSIAG